MSFGRVDFEQPENPPTASAPPARRNWLWVILPFGCLSLVLFCCGGFLMIGVGIMATLKTSTPYTDALQAARSHEEVKEALGEPIEGGFLVQGNIQVNNDDGQADLSFPVSGPRGSGNVSVTATKKDGVWDYQTMSLRLEESGRTIDLLEKPDGAPGQEVPSEPVPSDQPVPPQT